MFSIDGVGAYDTISRKALMRGVADMVDGGKSVLLRPHFFGRRGGRYEKYSAGRRRRTRRSSDATSFQRREFVFVSNKKALLPKTLHRPKKPCVSKKSAKKKLHNGMGDGLSDTVGHTERTNDSHVKQDVAHEGAKRETTRHQGGLTVGRRARPRDGESSAGSRVTNHDCGFESRDAKSEPPLAAPRHKKKFITHWQTV